jgi:YjbE family integral membrane protein
MSLSFLLSGLSIVLIDLLMGGDNALAISAAVRTLTPQERRLGITCGVTLAVLMRILLTIVAARILTWPFFELAGGLLVLWMAFKVLLDTNNSPAGSSAPHHFWQVLWIITATDLILSLDNILAIAGVSHGNFALIVFGLSLSIPFVVFSRHLLSNLMDRYPVLIYVGVTILAKVAGDMMAEDPWVIRLIHPSPMAIYFLDVILIIAVLASGFSTGRARRIVGGESHA